MVCSFRLHLTMDDRFLQDLLIVLNHGSKEGHLAGLCSLAFIEVVVGDDQLREFLPDESEENIRQISDIIKKSGGKKGLADIHDEIEKLYRNEKASDIYRIVRHNIKDICI